MSDDRPPTNLEDVIDRLDEATRHHDEVTMGTIVEAVGQRSFGPMLLVAGLIGVSPLSSIPVITVAIAVLVIVIAAQLLLQRRHFWLPQWVVRRAVSREKLAKGLSWIRPAARFVDRFLRRRLIWLTEGAGAHAIAVTCIVIAAAMPPLALVPFAPSTAGAALAAFGLSLTAHDGVVGVIAFVVTGSTVGLVVRALISG